MGIILGIIGFFIGCFIFSVLAKFIYDAICAAFEVIKQGWIFILAIATIVFIQLFAGVYN